MARKSVRDIPVRGRRVLIRADLNVPLDNQQSITDDRRIRMFLPTLRHVAEQGGRVTVMSHLGRPTGDPKQDQRLSLAPVAQRLGELLGRPVSFAGSSVGPSAREAVGALQDGDVLLLENLRFHAAETIIDQAKRNPDGKLTPDQDTVRQDFGQALAAHGEAYVNDAFGTCHRKHVSMYDVPQLIPAGSRTVGFLVEKELHYLGQALEAPKRPFVAILGGAKVSDKIGVIRSLAQRVDYILVGGAMAFTFWAAQGRAVGKSLCERDKLDLARALLDEAGAKLHLPSDCIAASELRTGVETQLAVGEVPAGLMGLDIGPQTREAYGQFIRAAGTVVWNGPMGAFEVKPFDEGTFDLARMIADATEAGAVTVIGGGDSAAAVEQAGLAERMTHISTGGGASLKFLEGKRFDPIEVLDEA
ncbi:MAG: phosphoglycerate kinase [Planctomycetes bacterium]|nr:phosphoglycerate kinase [Planctomycetota bacterium]